MESAEPGSPPRRLYRLTVTSESNEAARPKSVSSPSLDRPICPGPMRVCLAYAAFWGRYGGVHQVFSKALLKVDPKVFTALSNRVYELPGVGTRIAASFYDRRLVTVFAWPTA